jgi:hypothetical protein
MRKAFGLILLLALSGCADMRPVDLTAPCMTSPGGFECQVERYTRAP